MSIQGFVPGRTYRHACPYATYDIRVIKVPYQDTKRVKIKFMYVGKLSKLSYGTDKATINKTAFEDWTKLAE